MKRMKCDIWNGNMFGSLKWPRRPCGWPSASLRLRLNVVADPKILGSACCVNDSVWRWIHNLHTPLADGLYKTGRKNETLKLYCIVWGLDIYLFYYCLSTNEHWGIRTCVLVSQPVFSKLDMKSHLDLINWMEKCRKCGVWWDLAGNANSTLPKRCMHGGNYCKWQMQTCQHGQISVKMYVSVHS